MIRVLIVEDEPASAEYIAAILKTRMPGTTKVEAMVENGVEALAFLAQTPCDLVITDIAMPRMDGIGLCQALTRTYPAVKIILVTGYQEFEYAKAAIRFGVGDYLLKPVAPAQLVESVARVYHLDAPEAADSGEALYLRVKDYLEAHLSDPLTLESVCRHFGMSQTSLSRLFRTCAGGSFVEELTALRIRYAKRQIELDPGVLMKELARRAGFSDPLYFSRVFRRIAGVSPSQYAQNQPHA